MNNSTNEAKKILNNVQIMKFLRAEALEKVASELQAKGFSCTAKAVELLTIRHPNIEERVQKYVASGVVGVLMVKFNIK